MAYLGDLATTGVGADSTAPHLVPKPDGKIDFADQMVFTMGWNGAEHRQDPISDLGPAGGDAPDLLPEPDGRWNIDDILAFTTMFSWASTGGEKMLAFPSGATTLPDGVAVPAGARAPSLVETPEDAPGPRVFASSRLAALSAGETMTCEVRVEGATDLTGAWVELTYDPFQLELLSVEDGGFLRGRDGGLFFHRSGPGWVEVAATRLDCEAPGIGGAGVVARLGFRIRVPSASDLALSYDLRSSGGEGLARGTHIQGAFEGEAAVSGWISAYPNPARGAANVAFRLPAASEVTIDLFDIAGRRVRSLLREARAPGFHILSFDGRSASGSEIPSGTYFLRLQADRLVATRKLVITR
jgi:hypothetical protein